MESSELINTSVRCPKCKNKLIKQDNMFLCLKCQKEYPVKENIPCLIDLNRTRKIDVLDKTESVITMLDINKRNDVSPGDWDTVAWEKFDNRAERRMTKIIQFISNKGLHLDIGCGRGDGTALIGKLKTTIGIDFGLKSCIIAQNLHPHILQADAAELPFPDNYFDSISCLDVFEHILEPTNAMSEMKRVLKEEGVLIFQTPSLEGDKIKGIGRFLYKLQKLIILPFILPILALKNPLKVIKRIKQKNLNSQKIKLSTHPQPVEILRRKKEIENIFDKVGVRITQKTRKRYWNKHMIIWFFSFSDLYVLKRIE